MDASGAVRGQSASRQEVRYGSSKRQQGSRSRSKSPDAERPSEDDDDEGDANLAVAATICRRRVSASPI
eukprot:10143716-Prorocentrum_lima.AAC.1